VVCSNNGSFAVSEILPFLHHVWRWPLSQTRASANDVNVTYLRQFTSLSFIAMLTSCCPQGGAKTGTLATTVNNCQLIFIRLMTTYYKFTAESHVAFFNRIRLNDVKQWKREANKREKTRTENRSRKKRNRASIEKEKSVIQVVEATEQCGFLLLMNVFNAVIGAQWICALDSRASERALSSQTALARDTAALC